MGLFKSFQAQFFPLLIKLGKRGRFVFQKLHQLIGRTLQMACRSGSVPLVNRQHSDCFGQKGREIVVRRVNGKFSTTQTRTPKFAGRTGQIEVRWWIKSQFHTETKDGDQAIGLLAAAFVGLA